MEFLKLPIYRLGIWKHPLYGEINIAQNVFDSIMANFEGNQLGRPVYVKIGHQKSNAATFGDEPAEGWVKKLIQDNAILYAIAEPNNQSIIEDILKHRYRFSSAEYEPNYINKETGVNVGPTLSSIALTNEPFITGLPENMVISEQEFSSIINGGALYKFAGTLLSVFNEYRIKGLMDRGIPKPMCEAASRILLAMPHALQVFQILEAFPKENMKKLSNHYSDSFEDIIKAADEDVRALGGKITNDGKYII